MKQALAHLDAHFDRFIADLETFLRIPSVSSAGAHKDDMRRCAEWIAGHLESIGMSRADVMVTAGHPIVYAEHHVDDRRPTVLAYGHYDVQPPDPLEAWTTPPFEPAIRDGAIYARGAVDDKGQLWMIVKAVESYLATAQTLPVNLKLVLEGEEECGSVSLAPFLERHRDLLASDAGLICDTAMLDARKPAITSSLRGITYLEFELTGSNRDLHSGVYGGAVVNPLHVLGRIIDSLHDREGRVTVDGFYDNVADLDEATRAQIREIPFDEEAWRDAVGIRATQTESGYGTQEATTARPSVDVHGVWGGHAGEGPKTIVPARAGAKLSARLVANQDSLDIYNRLCRHIERLTPDSMELNIRDLGRGEPVVLDSGHPAVRAGVAALENVFGVAPVFLRSGGTIPVAGMLKSILNVDPVMIGFGLNSDRIHAPDEHFGLDRFRAGVETLIRFFASYAETA